jgi:alkylation response protein AidB-like acyl-CoA dehydrogenase
VSATLLTGPETAVLDAAAELAVDLRARADETDRLRTVPADLIARAKAAGLCRLALPASLGGLELDPLTFLSVAERLAEADGSAGWTIVIGNSTAFFAWLDPDVARDLLADDVAVASTSVFAPRGAAVPTGRDRLTITGRWPFNSGCDHAEWNQVGVMVMDGDRPRLRADGQPDWRFAFFPAGQGIRHDTWRALGLRGTASHDLELQGLEVHEHHTAAPFFDPPRHDGPLWRLGFVPLLGMLILGFPLGVARRALDELAALAPQKRRGPATVALADDAHVQYEAGRAEAALQSARAFAIDVVGAAWDEVLVGDQLSSAGAGRIALAVRQSMLAAKDAVDTAFTLVGASAVYDDHPLQRCFRDIHTAGQHLAFGPDGLKGWARDRFATMVASS